MCFKCCYNSAMTMLSIKTKYFKFLQNISETEANIAIPGTDLKKLDKAFNRFCYAVFKISVLAHPVFSRYLLYYL